MMFFFKIPFFPDMRKDVQQIFKSTPHDKQVMMFSATLSKEIRPVCKKFMQDVKSCALCIFWSHHFSCLPPSVLLLCKNQGVYLLCNHVKSRKSCFMTVFRVVMFFLFHVEFIRFLFLKAFLFDFRKLNVRFWFVQYCILEILLISLVLLEELG